MRGRKLTVEEMECPKALLETKAEAIEHENYAIFYLPTALHRRIVKEEAEYRKDRWGMTYTMVQEEDYLSSVIAFMRSLYADAENGKSPHHNLLIECNFELEYTDWLTNGMEEEELFDFVTSLNKLVSPILWGIEFVKLEESETLVEREDPKTGRINYCTEKTIGGIVETKPTIYKSTQFLQKVMEVRRVDR